jgi:hypothetical protein
MKKQSFTELQEICANSMKVGKTNPLAMWSHPDVLEPAMKC